MSFITKSALRTGIVLTMAVLALVSFSTAHAAALEVTSIQTIRTAALPGSTFEDGLSWKFNVTVPAGETKASIGFSDLIDGQKNITIENNVQFSSLQGIIIESGHWGHNIVNYDYTIFNINPAFDLNPSLEGTQIQIAVDVKLPAATTPGSYSFNYLIESEVPVIIDTEAPVILPRSNIIQEATGPTGAIVQYLLPTVNDNVDTNLIASCVLPPGSVFPLGTTIVTCTATDLAGNSSQSTVNIIVVDTTASVITPQANIAAEATSAAGAIVTYVTPTATDAIDGNVVVTCSPISGSVFPVGQTTVNCSAVDAAGNTANSSFVVTVNALPVDTTAPVFASYPADFSGEATSASGAAVIFTLPTAVDAKDGPREVTCSAASGIVFPIGNTNITCFSTDIIGNISFLSFRIVVRDTTAPVITIIGQNPQIIAFNSPYVELGATALDTVDGVTSVEAITTNVNTGVAGTYVVHYITFDSRGNSSNAQRIVRVESTPAVRHTITTTLTGSDGSVTPGALVSVVEGQNQTITIARNPGYEISGLTIDGQVINFPYPKDGISLQGQPLDGNYTRTFTSVTTPHTITATFILQADDARYTSITRIIGEEEIQIAYAKTRLAEYPDLQVKIDAYQIILDAAKVVIDNPSSTRRDALNAGYKIFDGSEIFYEHPIFY